MSRKSGDGIRGNRGINNPVRVYTEGDFGRFDLDCDDHNESFVQKQISTKMCREFRKIFDENLRKVQSTDRLFEFSLFKPRPVRCGQTAFIMKDSIIYQIFHILILCVHSIMYHVVFHHTVLLTYVSIRKKDFTRMSFLSSLLLKIGPRENHVMAIQVNLGAAGCSGWVGQYLTHQNHHLPQFLST